MFLNKPPFELNISQTQFSTTTPQHYAEKFWENKWHLMIYNSL